MVEWCVACTPRRRTTTKTAKKKRRNTARRRSEGGAEREGPAGRGTPHARARPKREAQSIGSAREWVGPEISKASAQSHEPMWGAEGSEEGGSAVGKIRTRKNKKKQKMMVERAQGDGKKWEE